MDGDIFLKDQAKAMEARVVRYADLKPCLNAFIDTRSPGSERKENFTVIGPGVSENPDQHVHIPEPHGFNIGGARQPPECLNSQHSHETAETIIVHSGTWRFDFGEDGTDARVFAGPGDVVSVPVHVFRGFTNVGDDTGYLFFVLGGDDPGRVTWAPQVFELAKDYGLVLLDNGSLVDTAAGEAIPAGEAPMAPTTAADVARLRVLTQGQAETVVARNAPEPGAGERVVIGPGGPLAWPHGFTLSRLTLSAGEASPRVRREEPEVVFVQCGQVEAEWGGGRVRLGAGDTATIPRGEARRLSAVGAADVFLVRGGDAVSAGQPA